MPPLPTSSPHPSLRIFALWAEMVLLLGRSSLSPYRLFPTQLPMDVLVVPWKEDGHDIRDFFSPGRSLVSTASERSMCRWWCRSVSEYPRCLILIGVRGCLHRCCGGLRVACPSRGTGSDRDRLFLEHGGGSIIVQNPPNNEIRGAEIDLKSHLEVIDSIKLWLCFSLGLGATK